MIWLAEELKNPISGVPLKRDSPHSFSDGATRFPVIENIPFLRVDRDDLRAAALKKLDAGDARGALVLLFQDQDDWAQTAAPTEKDLLPLFENENLTLRDAMRCLRYGAVADYFAYRWSDPTFLSGLCLLENHLPTDAEKVFELACGIGHYLREFALRRIEATGADVVFSKLWLARRFVAPKAKLVCFDANYDFPFAGRIFDAALCHDAFYFLPEKRRVASELKRTTRVGILIGHAHNAEAENYSSGAAVSAAEYAAMFEDSTLYDDAEVTTAFVENRRPARRKIEELKRAEAIDLVYRAKETDADEDWLESFLLPTAQRLLKLNPLLCGENGEILSAPRYPSERYQKEYAPLSGYLNLDGEKITPAESEKAARGNWFGDERLTGLIRRRIFLDLPENW